MEFKQAALEVLAFEWHQYSSSHHKDARAPIFERVCTATNFI